MTVRSKPRTRDSYRFCVRAAICHNLSAPATISQYIVRATGCALEQDSLAERSSVRCRMTVRERPPLHYRRDGASESRR
jgi:hypothetical protein